MRTEHRTLRQSAIMPWRTSFSRRVLSLVLFGGAYFCFSTACLGQEEQLVAEPSARTVSQAAEDSPKTTGQDEPSAKPAHPEKQSGKKRVRRGSFVIAPI